MIQLDAVALISIFVECVLYGISLVLYSFATVVLVHRKHTNGINKPMFSAIIAMFIMGTIHVSLDLRRLMTAFLYSPEGATSYLKEINTPIYITRSTTYVIQTLTGDGFVLYRLYLVWNGDKRVFYPLLFALLVNVAVGIVALHGLAVSSSNATVSIFESKRWIASFYSMTLFTNIACSSLLAWRIWRTHKNAARLSHVFGDHRVMTAAIIVIESGAIYSVCLILLLALYLSNTYAQYILIDSASQLVGIVFSLIIVRVGLGLTADAPRPYRTTSTHSAIPSFSTSIGGRHSGRGRFGTDTFSAEPVQVHITKVTNDDSESPITAGQEELQLVPTGDEKSSKSLLPEGFMYSEPDV